MSSAKISHVFGALGFLFFGALSALFMAPLWPVWSTAIPGGLQDTRLFLWNAWWWREALGAGFHPFYTDLLFHPFGISLLTHDMPLWNSALTLLLTNVSWIASINVTFWLTWTLAGFCTYALAREKTGSRAAALVAGVYVMSSSYLSARAMQNWGQFNMFAIPLFLWMLLRARKFNRGWWIAGVALAWTAACHYYFLIYSGIILAAVMGMDICPWRWRVIKRDWLGGFARKVLIGFALVAGAVGLFILVKPGIWWVGPVKLSMQTPANVLLVFWIALATVALGRFRLVRAADAKTQPLKPYLVLIGVALVCLLPLLIPSFRIARSGDYPKQTILWKTHPVGGNLLSPLSPNSQQVWWGKAVSQWDYARGIDPQEQATSIGWVCLVILFLSGAWKMRDKWFGLAAGATVLSLGVYLHVLQWNLWLPLPFYVLRLLPVTGNVRIPERWMAVAVTALAVVLAQALVRLSRERGWNLRMLSAVVAVLILLENWPGVPAAAVPPPDAAELRLRDLPSRGVLPVPLYVGDSSKGMGNSIPIAGFHFPIDDLLIQTTHHKPMVGGYIGRIPRRLLMQYRANALTDRLIRAEESSEPVAALDPTLACAEAERLQIDHVLITRDAVPAAALAFIQNSLPLHRVGEGRMRDLYEISCRRATHSP